MKGRLSLFLVVLCCLPISVFAADPFDGMMLTVSQGPGSGEITLQWVGGDPMFKVFRATGPSGVVDQANQLGESAVRSWVDSPPAGMIFYYVITSPCVYNPPEICNGIDDDCDGSVPPDEADADGDGVRICEGDCNDANASIFPGHPEACDNLDNDCDGMVDGFSTACGLGACAATGSCFAGVDSCAPGRPSAEVCNGIDDDCNGVIDDPGSEMSCNLPHAAPRCASGSCVVNSCNTGFSNCDATSPNGCECGTAGCCGSACQVIHYNGLDHNFFDCFPLGAPGTASTYNATMANEASAAWQFTGTTFTGMCGTGPGASLAVIKQTATSCAVWVYTTTLAGYVHLNAANQNCFCPVVTVDLTWR